MSALKDSDEFGARMKGYEGVETSRKLDPRLPIYARMDGRGFSRFTQGMTKPFHEAMTQAMIETTRYLVAQTKARIGYTQSDEISLVWIVDDPVSNLMFSGKLQKMVSVMAGMATAKFASVCPPGFEGRLPHFDARVLQLPDRSEAANMILWRAMDCRKNAISMVAQSLFSANQLFGKRQSDMLRMIAEAGVDYDDFPEANRLGSFLTRRSRARMLTAEELAEIPEAGRPAGPVMRSSVEVVPMPPFNRVANRIEVVFDGAEPILKEPEPEPAPGMTM